MKYTYTFDQLRDNKANLPAMFRNFEYMQEHGGVDQSKYFTADSGTIEAETPQAACEKLFCIYNFDRPVGYTGRSMSVSDIINLWDNEQDPPVKTAWFCDSIGFVKLEE